jgi:hypothetical protein
MEEVYRIDFNRLMAIKNDAQKSMAIEEEMRRVGNNICLTDILINREYGGAYMLRMLHGDPYIGQEQYQGRFKIQVLKTKWGEPVKPGDEIEWFVSRRYRKPDGTKYNQNDVHRLRMAGRIRDIEVWHSALIDEKGCIDVSLRDACILLDTRGVNFEGGFPLTPYKEVASQPTPVNKWDPNCEKKLQYFWLYAEAPKWVYDELPLLPTVDKTDIISVEKKSKLPPLFPEKKE